MPQETIMVEFNLFFFRGKLVIEKEENSIAPQHFIKK